MKLRLKLRNKWLVVVVVVQVLQWIIDFCPWLGPYDYLELYPIKGAAAASEVHWKNTLLFLNAGTAA